LDALNEGRLAGAAVDVVSHEPVRPDNPLLTARNCLITPHLAWPTREAQKRLLVATIANVVNFLQGPSDEHGDLNDYGDSFASRAPGDSWGPAR